MAGYDYGNARLRAMKARLLSSSEMEKMAAANNLQALIAELSKTPYRQPVQAALARTSGLECISVALHHDLQSTVQKIDRFYDDSAGEMVGIVLRAYDIRNLKAILRGLSKRASPKEILLTVLPTGILTPDILSELSRSADPRAAIELLATMGLPFAYPLLRLRSDQPGAETPEMELALDQWHFEDAFDYLRRKQKTEGALFFAMQLDADITNLYTVMRFVFATEERDFLREWLGVDDVKRIFIGPGKLSFDRLANAATQDAVEDAIEILGGTIYEAPLKKGLEEFTTSDRLSVFEQQLNRFRVGRLARLIRKDPLGIGVVLGYLALKTTEVSNLRWIAHGTNLAMKANDIRTELVYFS